MTKLEEDGFKYISDTFESLDGDGESNFLTHTDLSSLSSKNFTKENALDFLYSPEQVNRKYSSEEVLGIFEGIFFMPDGYSINRRFYSEELWKNTVESKATLSRLERGMLGMFEHPGVSGSETSSGLMTTAHPMFGGLITKNLKIVESNGVKYGIGKSYIMNNAVGNAINVLLKAKDENGKSLMKLAVSSRAWARSTGKDKLGNEILDPKNYRLETFDVVMNPGIPEAYPEYKIIESAILNSVTCGDNCQKQIRESLISELNLKAIGC